MSVGLVSPSLSRVGGGILHPLVEHAHGLSKLGLAVAAYGLEDPGTATDRPLWRETPSFAAGVRGPRAFGFAPSLAAQIERGVHDLTHLHGLWMYPSVAVARWGRRTGRPVCISPHGMLDPWALANSRWKKRAALALFENANLRSASCLHALNVDEALALRRLGLRNPIAVIPNGVAPPPAQTPDRPAWMGEASRRTLLFLGRLHPKKGLVETLDAWRLLRRDKPDLARDWRLAIAGWDDGGHAASLQARAADAGLSDVVVFPGALFGGDKAAALAHADAFILASRSEGLPMGVLEAWSYGLPVFMTRACNLPEGFASGGAIEIDCDAESIARTLAERLADPGLSAVGKAARALAADRFRWPDVCERLERTYAWLINGAQRPDFVEVSA